MRATTVLALGLLLVALVQFHSVDADCSGLRRLTCHIQCTKQGTQCNVHTCECYHYKADNYKSLYMMLRVPVAAKPEKVVADSDIAALEAHDDVDVVLLNDI